MHICGRTVTARKLNAFLKWLRVRCTCENYRALALRDNNY